MNKVNSKKNIDSMVAGLLKAEVLRTDVDMDELNKLVSRLLGGLKIKVPVDPNKPTRGASAFILFSSSINASVRAEFKDQGLDNKQMVGLVAKEISKRWKTLSEAEKEPFETKAKAAKAGYDKAMASYVPPEPTALITTAAKVKAPVDPTKPKRSLSAYFLWMADNRQKIVDANPDVKQPNKLLGAEWRALTDDQKKPYNDAAADAYSAYKIELEAWKSGGKATPAPVAATPAPVAATPAPVAAVPGKAAKKPAPKAAKKGKKSPGEALHDEEVREEFRAEHEDWSERKLAAEVRKAWIALDDDEKSAYEERAE